MFEELWKLGLYRCLMFCLFNKYEQYFSHNSKAMHFFGVRGISRFPALAWKSNLDPVGEACVGNTWATEDTELKSPSAFPLGCGLTLSVPAFPRNLFKASAEKQSSWPPAKGQAASLINVFKHTLESVTKGNAPGPCYLLCCHLSIALTTCLLS